MPPTTVHVVPHTHWDREWYSPFQTFRLALLELVDGLLALMESDPSYTRFLLDGQMAAIDDYLELRPENESRIRALAGAKRLSCGPWYILMDEFLVSGETIVRNLQMGLERAAFFGGAMEIGYLPDMFGHIAQMPQILCAAGFSDAVVWRGVPGAIEKDAFIWTAPDGSAVRAQYLVTGYSEGASIGADPDTILRRVQAFSERYRTWFTGPVLYMNGTDHERPEPHLGEALSQLNASQGEYELVISSLSEALAGRPRADLPIWHGELRSSARANLLMGVASNRVDVKQAAARAERGLEQLAEPLATLLLEAKDYPGAALQLAWKEVVRNSAHDSICACSHDDVAVAVLGRFAAATQIADGVRARALAAFRDSVREAGNLVLNPSPRRRGGTVELTLAGEEIPEGSQRLGGGAGMATALTLSSTEVHAILGQIDAAQDFSIGSQGYVCGVALSEDPTGIDVVITVGPTANPSLEVEQLKRDLLARMELRPSAPIRVQLDIGASSRVLARVEDIPGFGWTTLAAGSRAPGDGPQTTSAPQRGADPVPGGRSVEVLTGESGTITLRNTSCEIVVEPLGGTFSFNGLAGFDRLVDSGDAGDTYNYSPPEHDEVIEEPTSVELQVIESGPVRAAVEVRRTYTVAERLDDTTRSRVGSATLEVTSRLELHARENFVRVSATIHNRSRDHRLRVHFPLPEPADHSTAESAFAIVERGLEAEGGPSERGIPTYPSRRFVSAGGLTVAHEGLAEYELIEIEDGRAHALALTLLRATGMLSRLTMAYRPFPAGPTDSLEGPEMLGSLCVNYAVTTASIDPYELVDDAFLPLIVVPSLGGGEREPAGALVEISGAELSSLRRVGPDLVEVRAFNPRATPSVLQVCRPVEKAGEPSSRAVVGSQVDLRGRAIGRFGGTLPLGPFEIVTLRLSLG